MYDRGGKTGFWAYFGATWNSGCRISLHHRCDSGGWRLGYRCSTREARPRRCLIGAGPQQLLGAWSWVLELVSCKSTTASNQKDSILLCVISWWEIWVLCFWLCLVLASWRSPSSLCSWDRWALKVCCSHWPRPAQPLRRAGTQSKNAGVSAQVCNSCCIWWVKRQNSSPLWLL